MALHGGELQPKLQPCGRDLLLSRSSAPPLRSGRSRVAVVPACPEVAVNPRRSLSDRAGAGPAAMSLRARNGLTVGSYDRDATQKAGGRSSE